MNKSGASSSVDTGCVQGQCTRSRPNEWKNLLTSFQSASTIPDESTLTSTWLTTLDTLDDVNKMKDFITNEFDDITMDWDPDLKQAVENSASTAMRHVADSLQPLPPVGSPTQPSVPERPQLDDAAKGAQPLVTKLGECVTPLGNTIVLSNYSVARHEQGGSAGEMKYDNLTRVASVDKLKNRKWIVLHFRCKDLHDWTPADLEIMASTNKCDSSYLLASYLYDAWWIIDVKRNPHLKLKSLTLPEGLVVDIDYYTLSQGGLVSRSMTLAVNCIWEATKHLYGTFHIKVENAEEFTFARCFQSVRWMDWEQWTDYIANIECLIACWSYILYKGYIYFSNKFNNRS